MNIINLDDDVLHAYVKRHRVELLISLAFFVGGGYFLYHLIGILFQYIISASFQDWADALPGMFIMLAFALLISWPGIYMSTINSIVVDLRLGIIVRRKEFLGLHTRGKVIQLSDVESLVCRQKIRNRVRRTVGSTSGTTTSVTSYMVDLELKNGQLSEVLEYADKEGAKELARSIACFAGIPFQDRP